MRWHRFRAVVALLLVAGSLTACIGKSSRAASHSTPKLDVELIDRGLTFSSKQVPAGQYAISFEDRRSHVPAGQRVEVYFGPAGPLIGFVKVAAGTTKRALLVGNYTAWFVINGDDRHNINTATGFYVTPTKQYPVPAT